MKIAVRNYRGIERADIEVSRIALLVGGNGAGKTSICEAVGAALTGECLPIPKMTRGEARALLHKGADIGRVEITTDTGRATVVWPTAAREAMDEAPEASRIACGLESLPTTDDKRRAVLLAEYLKTEPTFDDLAAPLREAGIADDTINGVWKAIEVQGWDGVLAGAKEKGVRFKGQWEGVTGERYGKAKAPNWLPSDWDQELETASQTTLEQDLAIARDQHEQVVASVAVDGERLQQLRDKADTVARLESSLMAKQREEKEAFTAKTHAEKSLAEVPAAPPKSIPCPSCKTHLIVITASAGYTLEARQGDGEDIWADKRTHWRQKEQDEAKRWSEAKQAVTNLQRDVTAAKTAAEELAAITANSGGGASNQQVEAAREAVRIAENRLNGFVKKNKADQLHKNVVDNGAIQAVLAEDGVRRTVLTRALDGFNSKLAGVCEAAGWKAVAIGSDLGTTYGDRQYRLLSESERYRCRVVLQLIMAQIDASPLVVIDRADVLQKTDRNRLLKAVQFIGIPALIAMTIDADKEQVPDAAAAGIGQTYMARDCVVEPLNGGK